MTSAVHGTGKYEQLLERCRTLQPVSTAVAHPCEASALAAVVDAAELGLIAPILVGPKAKIEEVAKTNGIALGSIPIVDAPHSHASASRAVELVRQGKTELLMKGSLHTDELLGAVVARDTGLRTGRRLSHVFIMDVPTYHKVLIVTDAAINIAPTLEDKVDICQNAIDLAISLGLARPKVAILAAVETVTSKMPATLDAAALCKMAERGQITGAILDGPLAFDNAISAEAARIKGIRSEVGGDPDILLVPDLEAGNILAKQLSFLANADSAGLVLGARVPIILTSRADTVRSKIASCAVAVLAAHARQQSRRTATTRRSQSHGADISLVLNAGSSSLKFCVYSAAEREWQLETRGQIDGIGTSPRFTAKNGQGEKIADERLDGTVTDARTALDSLAAWLRSQYRDARVLAVGHRVVHGGARYARTGRRHAAGARGPADAHPAGAAPSALQPRGDRGGVRADAEGVRRSPASTPASTAVSRRSRRSSRCRARSAVPACSATGSTGCRTSTSPSVLPKVAPQSRRRPRDRRAPRQRREPVRAAQREEHRQHARLHRARRPVHGHASRRRRSRRDPLSCSRISSCPPRTWRPSSTRNPGLLGISGISNDMRDLLDEHRAVRPAGRRLLRLPRGPGDWRPRRRAGRRRRARLHCRHRRELSRGPQPDLPLVGVAGHRHRPCGERRQGARRFSRPSSRVSAWVIPTNEELMIARHTSSLLGLVEARA